jgi:hypothetical protein
MSDFRLSLTFLYRDLYFPTMVIWENEDKDAHPASLAEKQIFIFSIVFDIFGRTSDTVFIPRTSLENRLHWSFFLPARLALHMLPKSTFQPVSILRDGGEDNSLVLFRLRSSQLAQIATKEQGEQKGWLLNF